MSTSRPATWRRRTGTSFASLNGSKIVEDIKARLRPGFLLAGVDRRARLAYQSLMKEVVRYRNCFVCGERNPKGLQARFFFDGRQAMSELTATETFEGYKGFYHGGIMSAMLDEVMIKAILAGGIFAVTAELNIRFHKPVLTGTRLRFVGRIVNRKGRVFQTEGEATDSTGACYASASGKYLEARPELKARLAVSLDEE